jgi:hypothetical protein
MYPLTEEQIAFILEDIRRRGVETESLQQNLLDHVCCILEEELPPGEDFHAFYQKVITRFFTAGLREIEEETRLLLTFKNYYAMKKLMSLTGIISSLAITAGAVFKVNHWPFAGMLLFAGIGTFALVFLPLMVVLKLKESKERREKWMIALAVTVGAAIATGILFRLMHWPGSHLLTSGSLAFLMLIYIPLFFFTGFRDPLTKLNTLVTSILLLAGAGMLMSLTNQGFSRKVTASLYAVDDMVTGQIAQARQSNAALMKAPEIARSLTSGAAQADSVTGRLVRYLHEMKTFIIAHSEGTDSAKASVMSASDMRSPESNSGVYHSDEEVAQARFSNEALRRELEQYNERIGTLTAAKGLQTLSIQEGEPGLTAAGLAVHQLSQLEHLALLNETIILNYLTGRVQATDTALAQ